MPTHGSPAAARQANARARPRAGVSGPAHRPRPAQPSAPAPVQDPALTTAPPAQSPDSYPHTSSPIHLGTGVFPCSSRPQQHPGIFANVSLVMFLAWPPRGAPGPCICCPPPHSVLLGSGWQGRLPVPYLLLCPSLWAGFQAACSCPGVPSGSLLGWAFSSLRFRLYCLPPQGPPPKATPSHCPGTCWPCSPVLDSQLLLLLGMALSFASLVRICLLCWIVSPMN